MPFSWAHTFPDRKESVVKQKSWNEFHALMNHCWVHKSGQFRWKQNEEGPRRGHLKSWREFDFNSQTWGRNQSAKPSSWAHTALSFFPSTSCQDKNHQKYKRWRKVFFWGTERNTFQYKKAYKKKENFPAKPPESGQSPSVGRALALPTTQEGFIPGIPYDLMRLPGVILE